MDKQVEGWMQQWYQYQSLLKRKQTRSTIQINNSEGNHNDTAPETWVCLIHLHFIFFPK